MGNTVLVRGEDIIIVMILLLFCYVFYFKFRQNKILKQTPKNLTDNQNSLESKIYCDVNINRLQISPPPTTPYKPLSLKYQVNKGKLLISNDIDKVETGHPTKSLKKRVFIETVRPCH